MRAIRPDRCISNERDVDRVDPPRLMRRRRRAKAIWCQKVGHKRRAIDLACVFGQLRDGQNYLERIDDESGETNGASGRGEELDWSGRLGPV
jgi:hypothetical protein